MAEENSVVEQSVVDNNQPEEIPTEEEKSDEESDESTDKKSVKKVGINKAVDAGPMGASFNSNSNPTIASIANEGTNSTSYSSDDNGESQNKENAAINEAMNNNSQTYEIADSIVVEEKQEVVTPAPAVEPQAPEYGDSTLDVTPEIKIEDASTEEEIIDDSAKVEEKEEATDAELSDMLNETITEETIIEETIEEQPVIEKEENVTIEEPVVEEEITKEPVIEETTPEVEEPVVEEQPKAEEPKEEVIEQQPVVTPVSVAAVDGYETVVGSQIQFVIDGTDVQINGLDGINYSFNGGILTIDVGAEATTLTVEVCNSVSSQVFNVLVNGIVG